MSRKARAAYRAAVAAAWLIVFALALSSTASATTTVSGVGNPAAPLVIDPGSPAGAVEREDINFYTGDDVFFITSMPDSRRIEAVTLGPVARGTGCASANVRLRVYEAEPALQPSTLIAQSSYIPLPERPENLTFEVPPVTLHARRAYVFRLGHGGSTCVLGKRLVWPHNEPVLNAGESTCSFMPFHYLNWYRIWHVQGQNDLPPCPYEREPTVNFDPTMPTGWIAVDFAYPNWIVNVETTWGPGPPIAQPPDCNSEDYGQQAVYWRPHPDPPERHLWVCMYTQFVDPTTSVVPDGWYYAGLWSPDFAAAPRDMYLELDPVDYESLLEDHVPVYAFDSGEEFYPQEASAFTDHAGATSPYDIDEANRLIQDSEVLAAGSSPGTGGLPPALTLATLGPAYNLSPPVSATADDHIDARGSDETTYAADSNGMRLLGHDSVVYGRAVHDPDDGALWLQYWVFYYYNPFNVIGIGLHEGDWEMVQIRLNSLLEPDAIAYAAHNHGYACDWSDAEPSRDPNRPTVFVAAGSHATYPHAGQTVFNFGLSTDHHWGTGPLAETMPLEIANGLEWLNWPGRWGSSFPGTTNAPSPPSPSMQAKWSEPSAFYAEASDEQC